MLSSGFFFIQDINIRRYFWTIQIFYKSGKKNILVHEYILYTDYNLFTNLIRRSEKKMKLDIVSSINFPLTPLYKYLIYYKQALIFKCPRNTFTLVFDRIF